MPDAALDATQALPFSIGTTLADRYVLRTLLGEGGMGAVFRAYDQELDEDIALKILHDDVASEPAALTRFRREVKLARRVTHRNVARTFDLGSHGKTRFLTMELITGESLARLVERETPALPEVLRIAAEIARGLAAAHVVGVVHRDLKPDNVMIADERIVLTDFGIARIADGSADVMRTGTVIGTPAYMAPEQLENLSVDGRTDVYALGTILFELLANRPPFSGDSAVSIAAQRLTNDPPHLATITKNVPDSLASFVHEMLARRREDRPDAQAVLDRLEALRGNAANIGQNAARLPTLSSETLSSLGQPRTVRVDALTAEPGSAQLATAMTSAIVDGLLEAQIARVIREAGARTDLAVEGSLRASGDRVRARLRVVGHANAPVWATHVDGTLQASLDFEDDVVAAVIDAVRGRTSRDPGPRNASLREAYGQARAEMQKFALPHMLSAVAMLEEIEAKSPGDPRVRTLLSSALLSVWSQTGGRDKSMLARCEELALRALEVDPTLAAAHHVIAQIRLANGELLASVRADEQTLHHDPRHAIAYAQLGQLMCEALHMDEGRARLELATRLDPTSSNVAFMLLIVVGMMNERDRARAMLAQMRLHGGELAVMLPMTRLAFWWNDHDMALQAARAVEDARSGAVWDHSSKILRAFAAGELHPNAVDRFASMTDKSVAPRRRVFIHEIAADYFAAIGEKALALEHVFAAAHLPSTNLLWLDIAPPLECIRGDSQFAEARAMVAARCAEVWGAVGSWSADSKK